MNKLTIIAAMSLLFSNSGYAAPTIPKSFNAGLNTGYNLLGGTSVDTNTHWFVFDVADGNANTFFRFNTIGGNADFIAYIFAGDTTGFNYASADVDKVSFPTNAGDYNKALTYMGTHDDDGYLTSPYINQKMDPNRYSLAITSYDGVGGSYEFTTNAVSVMSPVPEPESYAMMIAGLGVLGLLMRRKKIQNREQPAGSFSYTPA